MFSKLKKAIKNAYEKDKKAREMEEEGNSLKKTIAQIKAFFAFVGAVAPIVGFATIILVCICAILLPIIFLSQIIGGAIDAIEEFGTSVGNLFTSGCYGTDEECLEREEAKQEEAFTKSVEAAREAYRVNNNNGMTNELFIGTGGGSHSKVTGSTSFNIGDVKASVTVTGGPYSVSVNVPLLVSSLMYFETTVSSYNEMQQENMICDKLIALGFLEEEGASCSKSNNVNMDDIIYEWYDFALPEEDKAAKDAAGGYLKPSETLGDQTGVDVYTILSKARSEAGINSKELSDQCGGYNSLYTEGYGIIYNGEEEKSIWDSFVDWITGEDKVKINRLKSLAKFSVMRNVNSVCETVVTDPCPDGYIYENGVNTGVCKTDRKFYAPAIRNYVTFMPSEDRMRKYLEDEFVPESMLESYLFDKVKEFRITYERENGSTIDGTGDTKAFLNYATPLIQTAGDEYLARREAEEEKNEKIFADIADDIIELASIYEDEWQSFNLISAVCPGVTVTGDGAGVYSLEDYIAGVVAHEAYGSGGAEALKAQAVAARSYLLKVTNNCTKSIENSQSAQTFSTNPPQWAKDAANSTAGQVLVSGGEVILAMYDSFCYDDKDCPDATCNSSECTVQYTKLPGNEKHTITLKGWRSAIVPGGGHAKGMSQLVSYEMASAGKTYEEILKFFYSDSVEITTMASGAGLQEIDGFPARVSRATRDNPYIYSGLGLEGECAWYAVGRTNEILASFGSTKRVTSGGNGADFCHSSDYQQFKQSSDINDVRPGDVISWGGGNGHSYGHVAVIEAVYRDSSGNLLGVDISEGGVSFGRGISERATYRYSGGSITLTGSSSIWNAPASIKPALRTFNCEYPNGQGNGCQNFRYQTKYQLTNKGSYYFKCIIHIVE